MESPEGFANAILQARLNNSKRDSAGWEAAYKREISKFNASLDETWYWAVIFRALRRVVWELGRRYPLDPLFKPTGRKRPNGDIEFEYHRKFDQFVVEESKVMPNNVDRGPRFHNFLRAKKL